MHLRVSAISDDLEVRKPRVMGRGQEPPPRRLGLRPDQALIRPDQALGESRGGKISSNRTPHLPQIVQSVDARTQVHPYGWLFGSIVSCRMRGQA